MAIRITINLILLYKGENKMKRQIRIGVFETNSSSTHSLVMMSKDKFEKFKGGEVFWYEGNILSKQEILDCVKTYSWVKSDDLTLENLEEELDGEMKTYDNYSRDMETFYEEYKTESGEIVVSLGYYGYDG